MDRLIARVHSLGSSAPLASLYQTEQGIFCAFQSSSRLTVSLTCMLTMLSLYALWPFYCWLELWKVERLPGNYWLIEAAFVCVAVRSLLIKEVMDLVQIRPLKID